MANSLKEIYHQAKQAGADNLFTPRPIMLDIQVSIRDADIILCEMSNRNPNVFYELGLAHEITFNLQELRRPMIVIVVANSGHPHNKPVELTVITLAIHSLK